MPFEATKFAETFAAWTLSYSSLFLALAVLHRLTARTFGDRETARRTLLYIAVFPSAYFFTLVYTRPRSSWLTTPQAGAGAGSRVGSDGQGAAGRLPVAEAGGENANVDPLCLQCARRPGARGVARSATVEDRQPAHLPQLGRPCLELVGRDVEGAGDVAPGVGFGRPHVDEHRPAPVAKVERLGEGHRGGSGARARG